MIIKNNKIIQNIYKGTQEINKIYKGNSLIYEINTLPEGYTQVKYIETDGSSYLDSNYIFDNNTQVEVKFKTPENIPENMSTVVFYAGSTTYYSGFAIGTSSASGKYRVFYAANSFTGSGKLDTQTDYVLLLDKENFYLNNELQKSFSNVSFDTTYSMPFFAQYYKNTNPINFAPNTTRIYYIKIWDNGTPVRNMIPCYRNSDNEIGMYDLLNGVFYTNLGTGTFRKGQDV